MLGLRLAALPAIARLKASKVTSCLLGRLFRAAPCSVTSSAAGPGDPGLEGTGDPTTLSFPVKSSLGFPQVALILARSSTPPLKEFAREPAGVLMGVVSGVGRDEIRSTGCSMTRVKVLDVESQLALT